MSLFDQNVFINCPFDSDYRPLLTTLLFTVLDCGLEPRIASESADSGEVRVEKLLALIAASRFSIHDISRIEPLAEGDLPRFNMAFELGLDIGCRKFGRGNLRSKQCLILERDSYRYQKVLSDLSGNDIRAHQGDPRQLVLEVRSWIRVVTGAEIRSGTRMWGRFIEFRGQLQATLTRLGFSDQEIGRLEVAEFLDYARDWMEAHQEA